MQQENHKVNNSHDSYRPLYSLCIFDQFESCIVEDWCEVSIEEERRHVKENVEVKEYLVEEITWLVDAYWGLSKGWDCRANIWAVLGWTRCGNGKRAEQKWWQWLQCRGLFRWFSWMYVFVLPTEATVPDLEALDDTSRHSVLNNKCIINPKDFELIQNDRSIRMILCEIFRNLILDIWGCCLVLNENMFVRKVSF